MFLKKEELYYNSADGITKIYATLWIPDEIKMVFQIAHGMVEHIERYDDFAKFLNSFGILVLGNDHLGHGNSINYKEDFGYFSEENGNKNVIEDMYSLTKIAKERYKNVPYVFLGHSMGSYLLRQYLCQYGQELDASIIMGAGDEPLLKLKGGMAIIEKIASKKGWRYRSKIIDKAIFGGFNKKFEPAKTSKDWLSKDENTVNQYILDEKCNFIFTLNAYYNLLYGINKLCDDNYLNNMPKNLPILLIAGEDDPVGNFGKGIHNIFKKYKSIGMQFVEIKLYPNLRHEILNEIEKEVVYNDILQWLKQLI